MNTGSKPLIRRATVALLAAVVILYLALEALSHLFVTRLSETYSRINGEATRAAQIRPSSDGQRQVLLVGNSLLLEDIDVAQLNHDFGGKWVASRFAIEQTTYHDWYFGLRRILDSGARPDAVVICFEPRHLLLNGVRNDIFAQFLMRRGDLVEIARSLNMHPTLATGLMFASLSSFYAMRTEIRKNILLRLMPSLPKLTSRLTNGPKPPVQVEQLAREGEPRLAALGSEGEARDVPVLLLVMPPLSAELTATLAKIGTNARVPVIMPMNDAQLSKEDYQHDGYHLGDVGRSRFTALVAQQLGDALNKLDPALKSN